MHQVSEIKDQGKSVIEFTNREAKCIAEVVQGKSLFQIAKNLGITKGSVNFYLRSGNYKLNMLLGRAS